MNYVNNIITIQLSTNYAVDEISSYNFTDNERSLESKIFKVSFQIHGASTITVYGLRLNTSHFIISHVTEV